MNFDCLLLNLNYAPQKSFHSIMLNNQDYLSVDFNWFEEDFYPTQLHFQTDLFEK